MQARYALTQDIALTNYELVIDTRMSAEFFVLHSFKPASPDKYLKTLFSDSDAVAERCTAKSTIYTATLASALAVKVLKNYSVSEPFLKILQWDIKSNEPFMSFSH
jgi:hypothetical protein